MPGINFNSSSTDTSTLFRGQFIAGPDFVEGLEDWKTLEVSGNLKITYHPGLEVQYAGRGASSITLIGHMFDSDDPGAANRQIAEKLVSKFDDINVLIDSCATYGGRWLIIAVKDDKQYVFHDALGLRQVFYTVPTLTDSVWLMSQPGLAEKLFNPEIDSETRSFIDSTQFSLHPEYSWPAYATPFPQVRHLLPNHYLDLSTRIHHRYWPRKSVEPVSTDQAVDDLARRIQNLVAAVVSRFDEVVLGITAGLDSRLVLAASRNLSDRIGYVTVRQGGMQESHPDLAVPAALLGKLKLPHQIVTAAPEMSPEFSERFKQNVFLAHDHYGPDAEALVNTYNCAKVVLTGSGAEVGRCPYRMQYLQLADQFPPGSDITAEVLAALDNKADSEYAIQRFREWLAEIGDMHNVHIFELFSWENGHGNWLASTQLEFDIAWRENITPYNCRSILLTMLAVEDSEKCYPAFKLANSLIRKMWPQLLSEPINPVTGERCGLIRFIRRAIRKSVSVFG